jgi:hypothetical protein
LLTEVTSLTPPEVPPVPELEPHDAMNTIARNIENATNVLFIFPPFFVVLASDKTYYTAMQSPSLLPLPEIINLFFCSWQYPIFS